MNKVKLSNDLEISQIIYGMWRIADDSDTSPKHIQTKIEACIERGITTMDQADIYGAYEAEALLGACLKQAPSLRDSIQIITKCGIVAPIGRYSGHRVKHYNTSRIHINASVEHSLRLMNIEHIDLLLIHRPDPFMDPSETGAALDDLVKSGKVKSVGVSNYKPQDWSLLQSTMRTRLVTNQIEISVTTPDAFANGDLGFLQERGVRPMAWSPLGGGAIFGKESGRIHSVLSEIARQKHVDIATIAIAWLLAHPAGILPIIGTNTMERIGRATEALNIEMARETWFEIYSAGLGRPVA